MSNYVFVNPDLLKRIDNKVQELAQRWDYPDNQIFQLWQMVGTIESEIATKTHYWGDGIICNGWNGYDDTGPSGQGGEDPYRAWGGFYRQEPTQMVGWSIYLMHRAYKDGEPVEDVANRCTNVYGHWLIWEPEARVWGFRGFQDYYTEAEAQNVLASEQGRRGFKRGNVSYSDISGCYRVNVQNSCAKPRLRDVWKERIAA